MYDEAIGVRLRTLRRWRGMTLVELSGRAGLSKTHLSDIERGLKALDRRSYIAGLATALRVSEADIVGGPHLSADPVQAEPHSSIQRIREALLSNTLTAPVADWARPLPDLTADMARLDRSEYKFREAGTVLPALIDELHVHAVAPADEAAHRLALEALIEGFQTTTFICKDLGYADLAHIAAMRAMEIAGVLGDPVSWGKASSLRIHTMPATSWRARMDAAEAAADALEPHVETSTVPVLGMLTLAAALSATVAVNPDRAGHWMEQAEELATRVPDTPRDNWGAFSASNVGVWRVSLAVERGESGGAMLDLARRVDERRLSGRRGRHAAFLADVGRGLARDPRLRDQAVHWLRRAESVAPHKIRNDQRVRDTVAVMMQQSRTAAAGRELRGMASRMGVPH